LLLFAFVVVLAGCKVDATVDVTVREDGSGVVRVVVEADAEAVKAAESGGVGIEQAVRLDDLGDEGFRVGTWEKADDGSATVVISRPFDSVDEVAGIVRALGGPEGPLPELDATLEKGIVGTDYAVKGRIDLDAVTTGVTDDEELVARLQALGVDVNIIDQQLLAQVQSSFGLKVVVRLPDQEPVPFTPKQGATTAAVNASAQILNLERIIFAGAALGFLLLAIVVWRRGGKRRRRRRRAPAPAEQPAPRRPPARSAGPAPRGGPPRRRPGPGTGPPRPPGARPPGPRPPRPPGPSGPAPGPPRNRGGGPPRRPPPRP
jgi:hypothetical protein